MEAWASAAKGPEVLSPLIAVEFMLPSRFSLCCWVPLKVPRDGIMVHERRKREQEGGKEDRPALFEVQQA